MRRAYFKQKPRKPMRRTRIKVVGDNDTATLKQEIQALVRLICCYRDGGCVLRNLRKCGGEAEVTNYQGNTVIVGHNIIQADHLITRSNSATFADTRLIVCLCKNCHAWKKYNDKAYEKLVRTQLSNERKNLWDKAEEYRQAHKTYKPDWRAEILNLKKELQTYEAI